MLQKSTMRKSYGILNRTLNRPVAVCALDGNGTGHIHLCQHLVDFGDGEGGEEGIVVEFLLVGGVICGIQVYKDLGHPLAFRDG